MKCESNEVQVRSINIGHCAKGYTRLLNTCSLKSLQPKAIR